MGFVAALVFRAGRVKHNLGRLMRYAKTQPCTLAADLALFGLVGGAMVGGVLGLVGLTRGSPLYRPSTK